MKTKEEIRKKILEGMCDISQHIETLREGYPQDVGSTEIYFIDRCSPLSFKPSISDRMLFNEMIDKEIDIIQVEWNEIHSCENKWITGTNLLSRYYYPYYSWCDERELKLADALRYE